MNRLTAEPKDDRVHRRVDREVKRTSENSPSTHSGGLRPSEGCLPHMRLRTLTEAPRCALRLRRGREDSSYPSREVSSTPITAATNKVPPSSTLVMTLLAPSTTASRNLSTPRTSLSPPKRALRDPRISLLQT